MVLSSATSFLLRHCGHIVTQWPLKEFCRMLLCLVVFVELAYGQPSPVAKELKGFDASARASELVWFDDDELLVIRVDGTLAFHSGKDFACKWRIGLCRVLSVLPINGTPFVFIESLDNLPEDIAIAGREKWDNIGLRIIDKRTGIVIAGTSELRLNDLLGRVETTSDYYSILLETIENSIGHQYRDQLVPLLRSKFTEFRNDFSIIIEAPRLYGDLRGTGVVRYNSRVAEYLDLLDSSKNRRFLLGELINDWGLKPRFVGGWCDGRYGVFRISFQDCHRLFVYDFETSNSGELKLYSPNGSIFALSSEEELDISEQSRTIAVGVGRKCQLFSYEGAKIWEFEAEKSDGFISDISISFDGQSLAIGFSNGTVRVVKVPTSLTESS